MEVHHPHHPSHKKAWKEYLLEFFMLFFAVSLGFLAENLREVYIEKERSHELAKMLESDVRDEFSVNKIKNIFRMYSGILQSSNRAYIGAYITQCESLLATLEKEIK
ncbi:MAG: hypothetical protein WCH59_09955 [Chitinophagia bacterium]